MPQPNVAKRMECVELAPALGRGGLPESASKLAALPYASRGSPAERHSRSQLLLKGQWLFAQLLVPGLPLQPLDGSPLTRVGELVESSQGNGMRASHRSSSVPSDKRTTRKRQFLRKAPTQQRAVQRQTSS